MQLEYMLLIIIMLIIIPIVAISSNDTAFYIITSVIIAIASMKSFYNNLFGINEKKDDDDKEFLEEIENQINLDLNKLGKGFQTIKSLIVILFLLYCTFYLHHFWLKALSMFVVVHWINILINNLNRNTDDDLKEKKSFLKRFYLLIVNICALVIITFSAYSKFINH
ncbi:hypothetical protein RBH29_06185 [Herbivorax sp. ANBcel31]|uniref:hypothetical protein n=1 Tax=Herbivorax sp. ANBcel31 TaxID=3069754 RepID=UPI0027B04502|nr:hypothetical protein [Herbivorax sp. ANBcel31]MDQ2086027.1 hypothetical protein [Herbivorax sp. ANBcel31]